MNILEILIPIVGLLAVGTFRSLLIKVKKENDYVTINENMLFQFWNVINGVVIPLVVLFSFNKWYMAILYYIIGVVIITNIISGVLVNSLRRNNALIPFILNMITSILFIIYLFVK